eukprot:CAMPEP_0194561982 /NCGR_PEP_ID=MMETSP0292-20121207/2570_1 /TAXON_ID=39354 /ORGANISM="Heterosigma akashiwo, Strain CCMP2393" /LENGTH=61 /DNA_ID=CAMNT_0039410521 /DNA_START=289 /DNA_END=471 /DNA_ORIENTATION=+
MKNHYPAEAAGSEVLDGVDKKVQSSTGFYGLRGRRAKGEDGSRGTFARNSHTNQNQRQNGG